MSKLRRALLIGINSYDALPALNACVDDASKVSQLLERNETGETNYHCLSMLAPSNAQRITRANLRKAIHKLFDFDGEVLLYFSGHGYLTTTGGYICSSDAVENDWGLPMQEVMDVANRSAASEILMLFDCCHSGNAADAPALNTSNQSNPLALLRKDLTVVAASLDKELAYEKGGHGLFTQALIDALEGGAADHFGAVTTASVYSYIERRFGAWGQRPVFKSHATSLNVVRRCKPRVDTLQLLKLPEIFETPDTKFRLDAEFEPDDEHGNRREPINQEKVEKAALLKIYRDAGLLLPSEPGEQLFWTARKEHTVELTHRGKECWWLVTNKHI